MKWNPRPLALAAPIVLLTALTALATTLPTAGAARPLQFTSGGHVLGFSAHDVLVATGRHALRVEFVGATGAVPAAEGAATAREGKAAPLTRVTYPGLWEGITLAYDAPPHGLLRSTYLLAPGADSPLIRLRYNAPLAVESGGALTIAFASGTMRESAPVAWQDVDGRRVAVTVAFLKVSEMEVGFQLGPYDQAQPLTIDPTLSWNTFLGGSDEDLGYGIAADVDGNVLVTGMSRATWGTPIRAFLGGSVFHGDAFVAKLSADGALLWNTFLGGTDGDAGYGIAADADGNVYVTGSSAATWGTPIRAFGGRSTFYGDAFVAKLNTNGALLWSTFLGGINGDVGLGVAVDANDNVGVSGYSLASWGTPIRAFPGYNNGHAFVAKLDTDGALLWHTFLGGAGWDWVYGIADDANGNIFVTGYSTASWGAPIRAFGGVRDAFVAKLDADGVLAWHTFLGETDQEEGYGIAVDAIGNVYVTGSSLASWGTPIRTFRGAGDAFVAKLTANGALVWNTFLGGTNEDSGEAIAVDAYGNVYVSGGSYATWGNPFRVFTDDLYYRDAFVAKLRTNGVLMWNTFLGGPGDDVGNGIAVDTNGNVSVTGASLSTWGNPVRAFGGSLADAFVASLADVAGDDLVPGVAGLSVIAYAVDQEAWTFTTSEGANWWSQTAVTHDGTDAARSGYIADSQASSFETTGSFGAGSVSFWWKVSSEPGADYLCFYIDGVLKDAIAGEVGWQQKSYPVSAGNHTLKWVYVKNGSGAAGIDAAWVDQVVLPAALLLWTRSDTGTAGLWAQTTNPASGARAPTSRLALTAPTGEGGPWEATGCAHADAARDSVLWSRSDTGQAILAHVDPGALPGSGAPGAWAYLGSPAGVGGPWQATSYSQRDAATGYVLWTRSDTGQAILWQVDPGAGSGTIPVTSWAHLKGPAGAGGPWLATSYTHVDASEGYVLWTRGDTGQAILWRVAPGAVSGTIPVTSWAYLHTPAGVGGPWLATGYTHIDASEGYVLWTRGDTGQAILWQVVPGAVSGTIPVRSWRYVSSANGVGNPWRATCYVPGATPKSPLARGADENTSQRQSARGERQ